MRQRHPGAERRPGCDRVLCRRRHRLHLRGRAGLRRQAELGRRHARPAVQDHDERRQPGPCVRFRPAAQRRCRPGAPGVHHQPHDRRAPQGTAELRRPACRPERQRRQAHCRLQRPGRLLCREAGRGYQHPGGGLLPEKGHRAPVGLQVQRVRQPDRRQAVRAGRRKPDAGLPWRLALHQRNLP
ncbi:hypothetical protein D3C72_1570610 [compost metagenome]